MQIRQHPPAHLTYCLNVHPGETLSDQLSAIRDHVVPLRRLVAPQQRFGLGLRLSNGASLALTSAANQQELKSLLEQHQLYAFTLNGFPFGAFHGTVVKENVYRPDWRAPERRDYTCRLAGQLAALLPEGLTGSISTVPGSYKKWVQSPADLEAMVVQLADTAAFLADLRLQTGNEIHLGLEPEPDCYLETTAETVVFFNDHLLPQGIKRLADTTGCSNATAEDILRRHIGVCFDTCHLALQFENLGESLRLLVRNGIRISKIQISAALRTCCHPAAIEFLRRFCGPVYLHQVKTLVNGQPVSRGDLEHALDSPKTREGEAWRVHFHVPLYFVQDGPLEATASELSPAFFQTVMDLRVEHLEIETYTFNVLPPRLRQLGLDRSLAEEYRWVLARLVPQPKVIAAKEHKDHREK